MSANKDIMDAAIRLKELLVRDQKYDAAKNVRDIERAYLEMVNEEPVTGEVVHTLAQDFAALENTVSILAEENDGLRQRLEKLEKALSEHMAEVRENPTFTHAPFPNTMHISFHEHSPYLASFNKNASPKDIPFSVSLEYAKMGRLVKRSGWMNTVLAIDGHRDGVVKIADLLANDWMVLPKEEKP